MELLARALMGLAPRATPVACVTARWPDVVESGDGALGTLMVVAQDLFVEMTGSALVDFRSVHLQALMGSQRPTRRAQMRLLRPTR